VVFLAVEQQGVVAQVPAAQAMAAIQLQPLEVAVVGAEEEEELRAFGGALERHRTRLRRGNCYLNCDGRYCGFEPTWWILLFLLSPICAKRA
jgi:hypothetical protein